MRERGYIEGKNIVIDRRWALAYDEIVALPAEIGPDERDIIVASATPSALPAKGDKARSRSSSHQRRSGGKRDRGRALRVPGETPPAFPS